MFLRVDILSLERSIVWQQTSQQFNAKKLTEHLNNLPQNGNRLI
jgi:hypothetical protein